MKNTIHQYIQNFQDPKLRDVAQKFLTKRIYLGGNQYAIISKTKVEIIRCLPNKLSPKDVTWEWVQNTFDSFKEIVQKQGFIIFFSRLLASNLYQGSYKQIVNSFVDEKSRNLQHELYYLFQNKLKPTNLIVIKKPYLQGKRTTTSATAFITDVRNLLLYNLLTQFIDSNYLNCCANRSFIKDFHKSLNYQQINSVSDFNIETFNRQYKFYKGETSCKNRKIGLLKTFYMMLLNTEEGKNILTWQDGVDYYMLQSMSFNSHYENGFKPIPLNPIDPVPSIDKWLLMPNGFQEKSTKSKTYHYVPFDFTPVPDEKLKFALKHWCWNETVALPARYDNCAILIKFVIFVYELRNKYHLKKITRSFDEDTFTAEEIFTYVSYIKSNGYHPQHIFSVVKKFLIHISENKLYSVAVQAYAYFVAKQESPKSQAEDIVNDELILLEGKLKDKSSGSFRNTLYYIIFHIALSTEMRISQILNLKIDCLKKGAYNNYYLESVSKVSHGEIVKIPIHPYTKRFIETAIQLTQNVRDNCSDMDLKKYLFLHDKYINVFKVIDKRTFSDYLKKTCVELNIKPFTAENLRYTYMTKAIEFAIKNNKSLLECKALTLHKSFNTTNNHYVAKKIREYLEATYMVLIGDVDIQGTITSQKTKDTIPENLVNDNCGYCSQKTCIIFNGLDCLMCKGFIATMDRIPFFESKLTTIEKLIKGSQLNHDKEHLLVIKRLYLTYLEKLYILQEEVLQNG